MAARRKAPVETPGQPAQPPREARLADAMASAYRPPEIPDRSLTVYQRLAGVEADIAGMEWVKNLSNSKYASIGIEVLKKRHRDLCVKWGLLHLGPDQIYTEVTPGPSGTHIIRGTCVFTYINVDRPDDRVEMQTVGEAMDSGDKAAGKWLTNALKNHYKALFDIDSQSKDDIDSYSVEEAVEEAIRLQDRMLDAQIRQADRQRMLDAMREDEEAKDGLRRQIVALLKEGRASHLAAYKQAHGDYRTWSAETLKAFIAEAPPAEAPSQKPAEGEA